MGEIQVDGAAGAGVDAIVGVRVVGLPELELEVGPRAAEAEQRVEPLRLGAAGELELGDAQPDAQAALRARRDGVHGRGGWIVDRRGGVDRRGRAAAALTG
jgi:hypothetical protein